MFAKIYESEEFGQILVTKTAKENPDYEGPCPSIQVEASLEGVRMSPNISWEPTELGYDSREQMFKDFTLEDAESVIQEIVQEILAAGEDDD